MLKALDNSTGEVLQALKDTGIYDNSIIIFSSDVRKVIPEVLHQNENVAILTKFSSLAAPKVVKMTMLGTVSEKKCRQIDANIFVSVFGIRGVRKTRFFI